jgi:arylsulfatase A-like enzyme
LYKSKQYLYDYAREGPDRRPFALTVSFTHPHDPYAIESQYWDMYEDVDIELPQVHIDEAEQDPHSARLQYVTELRGHKFTDEQVKRARRAYYGAVSYIDHNIGELMDVLKKTGLADDTIM